MSLLDRLFKRRTLGRHTPSATTPLGKVVPPEEVVGASEHSSIAWATNIKVPPVPPGMLAGWAHWFNKNYMLLIGRTFSDAWEIYIRRPAPAINPEITDPIPKELTLKDAHEILGPFLAETNEAVKFYK